uniref:FYN-binding protein 2 n=1 Tax=Geotrypetes seraphini TaxID=260995 RepID=A0A6P8NUZ6_GEOSA|nr:FYN-binding protein 2 [Geotrypetes seraphini]
MEAEEILTDFKTLRARFQNACHTSDASMKPTDSLQWNTLQEHITFGRAETNTNISKKGCVSVSAESNVRPLYPGDPKPQVARSTPDLKQKKAAPQGNTLEASPAGNFLSKVGFRTQRETSNVQKQKTIADTVLHDTFKQTLKIWELASSHDDKHQSRQPPRHTRSEPLSGPRDVSIPAESSQITTSVSRNGRIIAKELSSSKAVPPKEQPGSNYSPSKGGNCSKTEISTNVLQKQMGPSECFNVPKNERKSDIGKGQHPRLRSLPSIEVLGPAPKKPERPPQVDLGPFLHSSKQIPEDVGALESDYMAPESDEPEIYEDELEFQKSLTSIDLCPNPKVKTSTSESGIPENKVLQSSYLFGMTRDEPDSYEDQLELQSSLGFIDQHPITETKATPYETGNPDNEGGQSRFLFGVKRSEKNDKEARWKNQKLQKDDHLLKEKKDKNGNELKKKFKITGSEQVLYKAQIIEDCKAGKDMLPLKQGCAVDIIQITNCPSGKWLAKDETGNFGYVYVNALKVDKETIAESQRSLKPREIANGVYDDAEGMGKELPTMSCSPSFSSDSFSEETLEETYDDVEVDSFAAKSEEDGKSKRLGKLFMKEKLFKLKNYRSKENLAERDALKNWKRKFPTAKEKQRSSEVLDSEETWYADVNTPISRNVFKNMLEKEKNKKMTKEEKLFREKFEYTKNIVVINIATVDSSVSTLKRGKLDLRITQGETLDVIDITDNNQIICRNSEGKYGYVSVEHLTFLEG